MSSPNLAEMNKFLFSSANRIQFSTADIELVVADTVLGLNNLDSLLKFTEHEQADTKILPSRTHFNLAFAAMALTS